MKWWAILFLMLAAQAACASPYSAQGINIWEHVAGSDRPFAMVSPDGKMTVTARFGVHHGVEGVRLDISGAVAARGLDIGPGVNSELVWSRTKRDFFVTTSNGGSVGGFHLLVFNGTPMRDVGPLLVRAFGQPVRCAEAEPPNIAGVAWLPNGHILAAVEIAPHSVCDSFGTFRAYEIEARGRKVYRSYDQIEAKRLFGQYMGSELRDADDGCVRDPKSCLITANHGG